MQVSKNGIDYSIVHGGTEIIDSLPNKVFEVKFNPMVGTWLSERKSLCVGDFKIYGKTPSRVEKIFKTFRLRNRNLGILLSGEKGMGKSVFMRYIAEKSVEAGLPVIVVGSDTPGIATFLSKIDQECVILFDEFEKNFMKGDDCCSDDEPSNAKEGGQNQFLSLFDGMDNGKKIFVIAVNNSNRLSSFFINRPGRFYYHFYFDYLSEDEVREYADDNLKVDKSVVNKLVLIARFHDISYDILSAIVTELNNGYTLHDTIEDLNIDVDESSKYYDAEVSIDGMTLRGQKWLSKNRPGCTDYVQLSVDSFMREENLLVYFEPDEMEYDGNLGCIVIPKSGIKNARIDRKFGKYDDNDKSVSEFLDKIDKIVFRPHEFGNANTMSYLM